MKLKLTAACLLAACLAAPMMAAHATPNRYQSPSIVLVSDSGITAKVKARLAAQHPSSLVRIRVETDDRGVVWLSGYASSQTEIDTAIAIARDTDGVTGVHNDIQIRPDD